MVIAAMLAPIRTGIVVALVIASNAADTAPPIVVACAIDRSCCRRRMPVSAALRTSGNARLRIHYSLRPLARPLPSQHVLEPKQRQGCRPEPASITLVRRNRGWRWWTWRPRPRLQLLTRNHYRVNEPARGRA